MINNNNSNIHEVIISRRMIFIRFSEEMQREVIIRATSQ